MRPPSLQIRVVAGPIGVRVARQTPSSRTRKQGSGNPRRSGRSVSRRSVGKVGRKLVLPSGKRRPVRHLFGGPGAQVLLG